MSFIINAEVKNYALKIIIFPSLQLLGTLIKACKKNVANDCFLSDVFFIRLTAQIHY